MTPDKKWMDLINDRLGEAYGKGIENFLNYAFERTGATNEIRCPCVKCVNARFGSRESVKMRLIVYGILQNYRFWYHHGEKPGDDLELQYSENEVNDNDDFMEDLLRDLHPHYDDSNCANISEEPNDEAKNFYRLLNDSKEPLYQGSKVSKLSALIKLLNLKNVGQWTNKSFNMLLKLLKEEILPENSDLPNSYYDAKKFIRDIGLSYEKIDACKNNCMLFWKDHKNLDFCEVCGISRWKEERHSGQTQFKANGKKIPKKILRYFPLKPRLQRLFMCSKTSPYMRWHNDARVDDEVLRHPADSMTWKSFDEKFKDFSSESRNVRLGLASDGFQPFTNAKTTYSIWPVILIPYNLPPSMCMNLSNFILSMLIPGLESPGDAIDIYLQPLIDELSELWHTGVETFDTSTSQNFTLRAALLWTINDFPAYANLSGWSTKGKLACPCCNKDTCSMRLTHSGKECYMGHRRYLPLNHKWRKDKDSFDGTVEMRLPPKSFSRKDILNQVQDLEGIILSKDTTRKTKISHDKRGDNWNKKSIFFELPYWETLLLRHNLDVMHIEKNICDSVLGTIMDIKGKTKDNHKTRLDLQLLNIRPELHPVAIGDDLEFPAAPYTLSFGEKRQLCLFLKELKMPEGFCSNIADCIHVNENKISGLKSHDCHIFLEYLISIAIRGLLSESVYEALVELSMFFSSLCSKSLRMEDLKQLERQIPITLCKLEKIFPPSFFDIMIHLPIHLAMEAMLGGPVQYRWMYPIEQKLRTFKSYVRNKTHPEASIAEGYIANECISLCSRYFDTSGCGCMESNDGLSIFSSIEDLSVGIACNLDRVDQEQAHIYILKNCEEVQSFYNDYLQIRASSHLVLSDEEWDKQFIKWFRVRVERLYKNDKNKKMEDLLSLSRGPTQYGKSFVYCKVNGYKFHTEEHSKGLRTQNSGILVVGNYGAENIDYYGVLSHIIELQFLGERRIVVFKCKWFDVHSRERGIKVDKYGFVSVNCQRLLKSNEPFVLATQASQVFYMKDNISKGWHIVTKTYPRYSYHMLTERDSMSTDTNDILEAYQR